MHIHRSRSRLSFRKRRRRSGCLSLVVLLGMLVGVGTLSWSWLERRLTATVPQPARADLMAAAQQSYDRGDLNSAIDLARQVLAEQPQHAGAVTLLARALVYRSYSDYNRALDRNLALEITSEAAARGSGSAEILAAHAFALQAKGQPAQAAQTAQRALEIDPDQVLARTALALAYGSAGNYEVSMRESQRAVRAANVANGLDALRALAIAYSDLGNYQDAARTVERAIELNNKILLLYFERALYALQLGDADAATVAYYDVLVNDPENVKARLRLCELSSLLREREAAIDYCRQVTLRAPSWADGWYQLGREYFLQGNFREAQLHLNRCSSLQVMQNVPVSERRFECWYLQGQAAEILGDCDALVATYNEFLAMAADSNVQQTWTYPPEGPPGCSTPLTR